tara:strand:- start:70 stop:228 length:159 start_codon:yes stop_codon:yes gene_type:complete
MLNRSNVQVANSFKFTFETQTWQEWKGRSEERSQLPTREVGPKAEVSAMSKS